MSNLLANMVTHGASDQPIHMVLEQSGQPLPASAFATLFLPFSRARKDPFLRGLGLGLYIVSQIAKALGGNVSAISNQERTCFTFRLPLDRVAVSETAP